MGWLDELFGWVFLGGGKDVMREFVWEEVEGRREGRVCWGSGLGLF